MKDLKGIKHTPDNPNQKSMEELLAEEQAVKTNPQIAIENSIRESIEKEKAARSSSRFRFIPYDSDDEDTLDILQFYKDSSDSSVEISSQPTVITPEVPTHSLSMGDEHLDTVPEKESDEFIKSSVENLAQSQVSHREFLIKCVISLLLLSSQLIMMRCSPILLMMIRYLVETSVM